MKQSERTAGKASLPGRRLLWLVLFVLAVLGEPLCADPQELFALPTYGAYRNDLTSLTETERPAPVAIDLDRAGGDFTEIDGRRALLCDEDSNLTWSFEIPRSGDYHIRIDYYPLPGKTAAIERELRIDGEIPFREARTLVLQRIWTDTFPVPARDNRNNDLKPRQIERPAWRSVVIRDLEGYYSRPYSLRFERGSHSLSLTALREPVAIASIRLVPAAASPAYEPPAPEVAESAAPEELLIKVQAEECYAKSDPTLYPIMDRTSPATEPYHISKIRLNTIGGPNWRMPGQWITWRLDIPESGYYHIGFKVRQNFVRGFSANRRILLDGTVPFAELENVAFTFGREWRHEILGGESPYYFYLSKGSHTVTLENTLGEMAPLLRKVEQNVLTLNNLYRRIIMITGVSPDPFRDYRLERQIPEMTATLERQAELLAEIYADLVTLTGSKGSEAAILEKLQLQLEDFVARPETVPRRLDTFKTNIGALGSWLLMVREQPLELDYLYAYTPGTRIPPARAGFARKLLHEAGSFLASFSEDYSAIGNTVAEEEALEVWVIGGRERAQIIKPLVDELFTPATGIGVNVKLVDEKVLLPATLSGLVGDVAMNIKRATPINFALRNAVVDLSRFPGFDAAAAQFAESGLRPYSFNGGVYALPEQEYFDVLFYRKDILNELEIEIPQTWEDLYRIIPVLQKHNLDIGLPFPVPMGADQNVLPPNQTFAMLLYQSGGKFYNPEGVSIALDSEEAIDAFRTWTGLFTAYKLDLEYNFGNRFRTGEMPIAIQRYDNYNMLSVFAPELRGLWDFAPVPGIELADGTIERDVISDSTACMLMQASEYKENAWEFVRWWVDAPTQIRFGREIESLLGAGGRYPTANREALAALPWPVAVISQLEAQWPSVRGIPEYPGGYFLGRHLDNAFRRVVFRGDDPRETLLDYVDVINDEIWLKRKEFGLEL